MHFLLKKDQTNTCDINLDFQGYSIKSEETVKLLGVMLDYKLNLDLHISNLCKKAAAQLNVLKRLKSFIGFAEKEVLVQSFVYSNFNYCPLGSDYMRKNVPSSRDGTFVEILPLRSKP